MEIGSKKIYRYKFTGGVLNELIKFASTHRYDDPGLFRENWDEWIKNNEEIIIRERAILLQNGFNGDIIKKMYTSVRYYFKNRSLEERENKKRTKYIKIDKKIIKLIDRHIETQGVNKKPSELYENFIEINDTLLKNEKDHLTRLGNTDAQIEMRIKKTYKNRCYIKQSRMNDVK